MAYICFTFEGLFFGYSGDCFTSGLQMGLKRPGRVLFSAVWPFYGWVDGFCYMEGKMRYVFHAHKSESEIHPRNSFVVDMFVKDSIVSLGGNIVRPMVVDRLPSGK